MFTYSWKNIENEKHEFYKEQFEEIIENQQLKNIIKISIAITGVLDEALHGVIELEDAFILIIGDEDMRTCRITRQNK